MDYNSRMKNQLDEKQRAFYVELGGSLRNVRTLKEMSQTEVASAIGMNRSELSRIESGEQSITPYQLDLVCKYINVPVSSVVPSTKKRMSL